jgi:hypothetical protein
MFAALRAPSSAADFETGSTYLIDVERQQAVPFCRR